VQGRAASGSKRRKTPATRERDKNLAVVIFSAVYCRSRSVSVGASGLIEIEIQVEINLMLTAVPISAFSWGPLCRL
jgi:hypothetical protein